MRFEKTVLRGDVHIGNGGHSAFAVTPEHRIDWSRELRRRRESGRKTSIFRDHRDIGDYIRPGALHPEAIGELIAVRPTPDGDALIVEIEFYDADAIKAAKAQEGGLSFVFHHEAAEGDEPIAATELVSFDLVECPCDSTQGPFVPLPQDRDYSCVLAMLPTPVAAEVYRMAAAIDPTDLAADGLEGEPHVTVLFGLHGDDPAAVSRLLRDESPLTITLGKTGRFANEEHDVLFVAVEGDAIHRLHNRIRRALPNTQTHPDYRPHVTLAYLRPGAAKKYLGMDRMNGRSVSFESLTFSDSQQRHSPIRLGVKRMSTTKAQNDGFKKLVDEVRGLGLNIPADVSPKGLAAALVGATAALAAKAKRKRGPAVAADDFAADFAGESTGVFGGGGPAALSLTRREIEPPHIGVVPSPPQCAKQRAAAKQFVDEQVARMRGTYRS